MQGLFAWQAYFLFKLFLYARGSIQLDLPENLAFLAFVAVPSPARLTQSRIFTVARQLLNAALAIPLLWHDSFLPPVSGMLQQLGQQGWPTPGYVLYFIGGYFDVTIAAAILAALALAFLVRRWRLLPTVAVALALLVAPLFTKSGDSQASKEKAKAQAAEAAAAKFDDPQKYLESFYGDESERVVLFKKPSGPAFDIVVLHVCSMSWADLKEVGLDHDDFFSHFDYTFTRFNSATSYSNPAVMRLLRSNCGQQSHTDLYNPASATCMLFESLRAEGYQNYVSMSHDGHYGDYLHDIKQNGLDKAVYLMPDKDVKAQAVFFDNSNTFSDFTMLSRWLGAREQPAEGGKVPERAALYFNSINLHAGSHWVDEKKWWTRDKKDQYQDVAAFLLRDMKKFVDSLKASRRNTVMIFLPEHGRALKGTAMQAADLRDIPIPGIALVPAGIRLFGPGYTSPGTTTIDKPSSYLALSWMLARMIEKSPFGPGATAPADLAKKVPATDFVAENQGNIVVDLAGTYFLTQKDKKWAPLAPAQLGQ